MAQRRGGYQGSFERCGRCGCIASKWSVYSDRMLCTSCLNFERDAYAAQEAQQQAQRDAAELASILEAEYRDEMDTRRSACAWAVQ